MNDMTEADFAAVRDAVNLARYRNVSKPKDLRAMLVAQGYTEEQAGRALVFWGDYERSKTQKPTLA